MMIWRTVWRAHIHHSWEELYLALNCSFGPKCSFWTTILNDVLLCYFWTKHWLQEFGIGSPPTHRVVFRSFPLFVCQQFQNKQTNTLRSCFHVALYSTFFSGTRLTQVSVIFCTLSLFKVWSQYVLNSISSLWKLLENCSQMLSTAHPSRDRKTLCPRTILSRFTNCKSINNILVETCNSREKGGWNRKVCKKERILDDSMCWWVDFDHTSFVWYLLSEFCLLSAWTCPSPMLSKLWRNAHDCFVFSGNFFFNVWLDDMLEMWRMPQHLSKGMAVHCQVAL